MREFSPTKKVQFGKTAKFCNKKCTIGKKYEKLQTILVPFQ